MIEFLLPYTNKNDIIQVERWLNVSIGPALKEVDLKKNIRTYWWETRLQYLDHWTTRVINVRILDDTHAVAFKLCFNEHLIKVNGNVCLQ